MIDLKKLQVPRKANGRPDFIGLYLKGENRKRFKQYCHDNNVTYSALLNALMDKYFEDIKYVTKED